MNILSSRLKQLREEKEVMQKEIAAYLNISASAYGFYEQGKRTPTPEILSKLASYFNVTTDYLLGRDTTSNNVNDIELNDKDKKDIEKTFKKTMEMLRKQDGLMLSGDPVTEESLDVLEDTVLFAIEQAKKINKKKFNPYKNKPQNK